MSAPLLSDRVWYPKLHTESGTVSQLQAQSTMESDRQYISTPFLVLRKTPYRETSLILAGISPHEGQVHFLARGARKVGRRQFPVADLFRVLDVVYRPGRDLVSWREAKVAADHAALVRYRSRFESASWLARFALLNVTRRMECPEFFLALVTSLRRLAGTGRDVDPERLDAVVRAGAVLVFLKENGVLPDLATSPTKRDRLYTLLDSGRGERRPPALPIENWRRILEWALRRVEAAEFRLPFHDAGDRE